MAKTFQKLPLRPCVPSNSYLSLLEREGFEGASQTFNVGSPLKIASGLLLEWVNPTDADIFAISLDAASGTTSATRRILHTTPEVWLEGNFLGSSAADNTLAAGDYGLTRDLAKSTTLLPAGESNRNGWYFSDTNSDVAVILSEFRANQVVPNAEGSTYPAVGDTNVRIFAQIIPGKSAWT